MLRIPLKKMTVMLLMASLVLTSAPLGLPEAAFAAEGTDTVTGSAALDINQSKVQGEDSLDLSQVGNVDWLHLKGNGPEQMVQIRKAVSSSVTFSVYGNGTTGTEGKADRGGDANYLAYSWDDGMAGYERAVKDTGFGVFYPKSSRDAGKYENVGWTFRVAPQPQESTVVFGIGLWQAKAAVRIYADMQLMETKEINAGGTSEVYKYQIKVPAHVELKVEGLQAETLSQYGNMSFSGLAVSSKELADKSKLQTAYNQVKDRLQGVYTDESWQDFVQAREAAKSVLEQKDAAQADIDSALTRLNNAQAALVRRDTNIMIDYTGAAENEYEFGASGDQQDRYQTFTVSDGFEMQYVQVNVRKMSNNVSDLTAKLYGTDSSGLPAGAPLAEATVSRDQVTDGALTAIPLSYTLAGNTRYALVLSQKNLFSGKYRWMVMKRSGDTAGEYFGKSVSGAFRSEAHLGTGILRIIKKSDTDRTALQAIIIEIEDYNYNSKLYTVQSWSALEAAINHAKLLLNDFDAKQEAINSAYSALQSSRDGLEFNMDMSDIAVQIDRISRAVIKGYTISSLNNLNEAVKAAKALEANAPESDKLAAYANVLKAVHNLKVSGKYKYETNEQMTAAFGFEGDKNASLAFLDGSYQIGGSRPEQHGPVAPKQLVTFGVTDTSNIKWTKGEGYLPEFISEYTKNKVDYKIETFANKHTVDNKDYVINYSRITATNHSGDIVLLPVVSGNLVPVNAAAVNMYTVQPGASVVREYAIEADKYEYFDKNVTRFTSLTKEQVAGLGSFEANYNEMKAYWLMRLSKVAELSLPNQELVNAFKSGYIDTLIIKDDTYLHVGENGYARLFSHDTLGILVNLIQSGDFAHAQDYLKSIPLTGGINIETGQVDSNLYWDTNWKIPWAYAVYLSKTGDASIFDEQMTADDGTTGTVFEKRVKFGARTIESDRNADGIMKKTYAIDSEGNWTIDNYSALTGLTAYEYVTRELYRLKNDESYLQEAEWAKARYDDLLAKFTAKLQQTITEEGLDYIPASVVETNDENRMKDSRDANWASMFLFGRWHWDGYLYGAEQPEDNINLKLLDDTYTYGINRRIQEDTTDSPYNFGGYPHGFYSSAYNAGYGSAALRGEAYRDMGIKAYEFMIENSMSGPFSWWEGINYPVSGSPWAQTNDQLNLQNTPGGGGSAQHMWGQSVNSKVLVDSLIGERIYDQNEKVEIIAGRGIPKEWVLDAAKNNNIVAGVQNYPALQGGRVGYKIVRQDNQLIVTFNSDLSQAKLAAGQASFSVQLPSMVNNIADVSAGIADNEKGSVTVPLNTASVTITLGDLPKPLAVNLDQAKLEIGYAAGDLRTSVTKNVILPAAGEYGSEITWTSSHPEIISSKGEVERPAGTTEVTLTATLRKDGAEAQKSFVLTVIKADKQPDGGTDPDPGNNGGNGDGGNNGNNGNNGNPGNNAGNTGAAGTTGDNGSMGNTGNTGNAGNGASAGQLVFKDVDKHWAKESILAAIERNLVKGYGDGSFRPYGAVTRSEFAVILGRALQVELKPSVLTFKDKGSIPAWAGPYVAAAVQSGWITGYSDQTFRPDGKITRLEMIAMIIRAQDVETDAAAKAAYTDTGDIPAWGQPYAAAAYAAGLIEGRGNNRLAPQEQATRAEAVTVILRMLEKTE
ncbi:S-layer homology domain-containing protein [Paenibacillus sp. MMS20-IR301]|uniref:S-layer homology domain-containing protein n=1 Tax=Paenibacillus sp. MMS20-IR301 TaxID=2895946 RepID=UPI0028E94B14|nr:S-layer homology domain-containing protein [Paenibacillus sp. MMS20-IR301]WNS40992.1 S-layer homology domain-containing protein [Paenibacillus sp. MMS20-IR301]